MKTRVGEWVSFKLPYVRAYNGLVYIIVILNLIYWPIGGTCQPTIQEPTTYLYIYGSRCAPGCKEVALGDSGAGRGGARGQPAVPGCLEDHELRTR